jgi:hypothetical protein
MLLLILLFAVISIGLVDFIKHAIRRKTGKKPAAWWIVSLVAVILGFIMSPLVPNAWTVTLLVVLGGVSVSVLLKEQVLDAFKKLLNRVGESSNVK